MAYVDGFVMPVRDVEAYKRMAKLGARVWMEHGALQYVEALADNVPEGKTTDFYRAVKRKEDETVVFAFVLYKSRAHRDSVMKKVMNDPRMNMPDPAASPFDMKRMIWGGFKSIVSR